ncbi:hypothetical protein ACU64V_19030 [Lysinibacillus capsici]
MSYLYNKEKELQEKFNDFISKKITNGSKDYYSNLSIEDFFELKTTLQDINNIITYKTTVNFMKWLNDTFPSLAPYYKSTLEQVLATKPSDNGFDVVVSGEMKILAEVKCNKPINNGYKFGSAQRNGIIKDIKCLLEGKPKVKSIDVKNYYKFLVIYDFGEYTLKAIEHLLKNLPNEVKGKVKLFEYEIAMELDKVYIVFLK